MQRAHSGPRRRHPVSDFREPRPPASINSATQTVAVCIGKNCELRRLRDVSANFSTNRYSVRVRSFKQIEEHVYLWLNSRETASASGPLV